MLALPAPQYNQDISGINGGDKSPINYQLDLSQENIGQTLNQSEIKPEERGYNELMDEYSLHQLIFRKGKLIDQTPEFVSFRRTYIDKWGPVSFILMNFEKLFTDHNV